MIATLTDGVQKCDVLLCVGAVRETLELARRRRAARTTRTLDNVTFVTLLAVVSVLAVLYAIWWWLIGRNVPKYPPLAIDDNDPAMRLAQDTARGSLDRFRMLFDSEAKESQVKIPFTANSGQLEHLWAEVLKFSETSVTVRYLTPPVSHKGKLERVHEHPISDIEDWVVIDKEDQIHGGYTQRVMFERARKQWGNLPPELEKQAARYVA
jgi:uncharacterized protein YegJ (DUF2314 family)